MAGQEFSVGGMSVQDVFQQVTAAGVSQSQASQFIGEWLIGDFGQFQRTFNYTTGFPAVDANCVSKFARTFVHKDWRDGQDLVQAEQTSGEEGFNTRFHRIENDLDALAQDMALAFVCVSEMRVKLRALLDEVRTELNRLNKDVFQLRNATDGGGPVVVKPGRKFVGATKFFDKKMNVFETDEGLIMFPTIGFVGGGPFTDPLDDPRVNRAAELGRFVEENPDVATAFGGGQMTKEKFVEQFGDKETSGGHKVSELVDILPAGARFTSPDNLVAGVAEREGAALRTEAAAGGAIEAAFGLEEGKTVAEAPIERFGGIPPEAHTALIQGGVTTVGELAKQSPRKLAATLTRAGVSGVTPGQAAAWVAGAKTLTAAR